MFKFEIECLVEFVLFKVFFIFNVLGLFDYVVNYEFMQGVVDLNVLVFFVCGKFNDMCICLRNMKIILVNMLVEVNFMVFKIDFVQQQIDDVIKVILGGFGVKNMVLSRLGFVYFVN